METLERALKNVRKYSQYAMAKEVSFSQKYIVDVLLGDDGKFWVPSTTKECGALKNAGYEIA